MKAVNLRGFTAKRCLEYIAILDWEYKWMVWCSLALGYVAARGCTDVRQGKWRLN